MEVFPKSGYWTIDSSLIDYRFIVVQIGVAVCYVLLLLILMLMLMLM